MLCVDLGVYVRHPQWTFRRLSRCLPSVFAVVDYECPIVRSLSATADGFALHRAQKNQRSI